MGTEPKVHPAAALLPMMLEPELAELARDIEERGQILPIIRHDGVILDGRNRLAACKLAGREPWFEEWDGRGGTPTGFAVSANLPRRHLNETQRAVIGAQALPLFEAEARARQGKRAKPEHPATTSVPRGTDVEPAKPRASKEKPKRAAEAAAKAVGSSARSVARAKAVLERKPELVEQLKGAKLTLKQAEKAIKREEQVRQVLEYRPPTGTYSVIVTDVPWRYDDELDGSDQARAGTSYPTMSIEEICAIRVPAAPDCALWFWVTTAFLIDGTAARVLDAWGFEAKTMLTWVKDRFGAGRYLRNQTEHCILAVRGKPLITGEATANVLNAPRRGHSEKPDEFFALVEKVCPAQDRLELFARKERKGWVTSGAELPKPSKKRKLQITDVPAEA